MADERAEPPGVRRALAQINLAATRRNAERLRSRLTGGAQLCAVVKARASGHGAVPVARAALAGGATSLAVATADEALELRDAGLTGIPVLVLGALSDAELEIAVAARADVVAWDPRFVEQLARRVRGMPAVAAGPGVAARSGEAADPRAAADRAGPAPLRVHVKLDTGMGRLGTRDADAALAVAELVHAEDALRLHGAMTHFATADDDDHAFVAGQLAAFGPFVARLRAVTPIVAHAANSAATLAEPAAHLDMVRCGIALHGCDPFNVDPDVHGLEPALELSSYVAAVKRAAPGESVGYGRRFVATRETWIGTVPIGYADGVRRAHTNNGELLVAGRRYPVVGTVSMDNLTIELGPAADPPVAVGERAVLIGCSKTLRRTVEEVARETGTIHHDVLCALSDRVTRRWHRDGEPVAP